MTKWTPNKIMLLVMADLEGGAKPLSELHRSVGATQTTINAMERRGLIVMSETSRTNKNGAEVTDWLVSLVPVEHRADAKKRFKDKVNQRRAIRNAEWEAEMNSPERVAMRQQQEEHRLEWNAKRQTEALLELHGRLPSVATIIASRLRQLHGADYRAMLAEINHAFAQHGYLLVVIHDR